MLAPIPKKQVNSIVNSFRRVFEQGDIDKLTKAAYNFIMLSSGFIAHYDINGFKSVYEDVDLFKQDILSNQRMNQWANFREGEPNYDYYMQKRDIYNHICRLIKETVPKPVKKSAPKLSDCTNIAELIKKEAKRFTNYVYCSKPYMCGLEESMLYFRNKWIETSKISISRSEKQTVINLGKSILKLFVT